jgi:hypothetical protein
VRYRLRANKNTSKNAMARDACDAGIDDKRSGRLQAHGAEGHQASLREARGERLSAAAMSAPSPRNSVCTRAPGSGGGPSNLCDAVLASPPTMTKPSSFSVRAISAASLFGGWPSTSAPTCQELTQAKSELTKRLLTGRTLFSTCSRSRSEGTAIEGDEGVIQQRTSRIRSKEGVNAREGKPPF